MFKRSTFEALDNWLLEKKRKPLLVRGARQVGKSSLIRKWAELKKKNLVEINFEKIRLSSLEKSTLKLDDVLQEIQFIIGRNLDSRNDIIFFDEIQKCPQAILSLRYFFEDKPEYIVISAGSLLDIALGTDSLSFPVGRIQFMYLGPVHFSEFVEAIGKKHLSEEMQKNPLNKISPYALKEFESLFRLYLCVGGMPESVQTYIDTKDFFQVRRIQKSILETYILDFNKYAKGKQIDFCETVFRYVPGNIGKKVKYSEILPDNKSRELKKAIDLLIQARILIPIYHTNATNIPLQSFINEKVYKLFFLDVGLVSAAMNESIENILNSQSILTGSLAEQFVAQHLAYKNTFFESPVYYWLRDKAQSQAEIDFVIQNENHILPIEVKAGQAGHLRSLHVFMAEHLHITTAVKVATQLFQRDKIKLIAQIKSNRKDFELVQLPLWLIEKINEI